MVQSLDIISVNIWQILISLINLLIIYRILKKFLFKPVQKVMNERQAQVDRIYGDANQSRAQAEQMKQEYEQRLASAREEGYEPVFLKPYDNFPMTNHVETVVLMTRMTQKNMMDGGSV